MSKQKHYGSNFDDFLKEEDLLGETEALAIKKSSSAMFNEAVHIASYDSAWSTEFNQEKIRLEQTLSDPSIAFEHIGSTSVTGMKAKPIVDIMVGLQAYPPSSEWIQKVCDLGYSFYGEAGVPERLYFTQRGPSNFNLAVVLFKGRHWKHNIKFRNFLRENPEACREYEKIKTQAINSGANQLISYSDFKKDFLQSLFNKMDKASKTEF